MAFVFYCPNGHLLQGDPSSVGQLHQCPYCGTTFAISQPAAPPAPLLRTPLGLQAACRRRAVRHRRAPCRGCRPAECRLVECRRSACLPGVCPLPGCRSQACRPAGCRGRHADDGSGRFIGLGVRASAIAAVQLRTGFARHAPRGGTRRGSCARATKRPVRAAVRSQREGVAALRDAGRPGAIPSWRSARRDAGHGSRRSPRTQRLPRRRTRKKSSRRRCCR